MSKNKENVNEHNKLKGISEKDSAANSKLVISGWNLPQEVVDVLSYGGDWMYDSTERDSLGNGLPDYSDLMVVTNVLLRVMDGDSESLPALDVIPAAKKIINDKFKADTSVIVEYRKAHKAFGII